MIYRTTGQRPGRHVEISPETSDLRFLTYRRTRLRESVPSVEGSTDHEEAVFVVLRGTVKLDTGGETHTLGKWDAAFIPPRHDFRLTAGSGDADLAEASAPSEATGRPQIIRYADAAADPALHVSAGKETYARDVVKLIDKNVNADRLLCGLTLGAPGNWTSWSPHEHAEAREEIYLYVDMPSPAFGIQMVYEDLRRPALVETVFEDDAVVITRGYHPNTGIPGHGIKFLWMMAAIRPGVDREWADMNDQPEFAGRY